MKFLKRLFGNFQILVRTPQNKFAVVAGSNFVGTPNQLAGCINDVIAMRAKLEAAGYQIIADLRDKDMCKRNWLAALGEMQARANATASPSICGHHHSHHGAQIRDTTGTESDGLSEVWCADRFDWSADTMITDKEMAAYVAGFSGGIVYWDAADCCHAADSLRSLWCPGERPRYIPNPALKGLIGNLLLHPMVVSSPERRGILLAACRSAQTSADAVIDGKPCGAFTNALLRAWDALPYGTYEQLMLKATDILKLGGYDQRPELDCPTGIEKLTAFQLVGSDRAPASALEQLVGRAA